jgi:hypothetical protein
MPTRMLFSAACLSRSSCRALISSLGSPPFCRSSLYFSRRFSRSSDRCPFFFSTRKACYQQCFESEMFIPDPIFSIPDPGFDFFYPGFRIHIKEFKYFNPKNCFLSLQKYDPGCSSRIRIPDPDPDFLPIPDPGVKKTPNPGSGSATLIISVSGSVPYPCLTGRIRIRNPRQNDI